MNLLPLLVLITTLAAQNTPQAQQDSNNILSSKTPVLLPPDTSVQAAIDTAVGNATSTRDKSIRTARDDLYKNPLFIAIISALLASLFSFLFSRLPRPLFSKEERRYRQILTKKLGNLKLVGPGMDDISVHLEETFVHMDIAGEGYRVAEHPNYSASERAQSRKDDYKPNELLKLAFDEQHRALLLIVGDPGSGKSTLLQYLAITAISRNGCNVFSFEKPMLAIYLPLREVDPEMTLSQNLQVWCEKHSLTVAATSFEKWLHNKETLVLLDGLDEVRNTKARRLVCTWIDNACSGLPRAKFVVTTRPTGYRGRDKVILKSDLLEANIRDFNDEQRKVFLQKWFDAAFMKDVRPKGEPVQQWRADQKKLAEKKTRTLLEFFEKPGNKSLRELSGIPMLLQIMAILWKKDGHLPNNRAKLYQVALDYLLEYRDAQRDLDPLLSFDQAQRVLGPACLWMQEDWQREEVDKTRLHAQMHKNLRHMKGAPSASDFCENLRDRAGILADNSDTEYIFRHKSFREFFAGLELVVKYNEKGRLKKLARGFFDERWEEPLRFFISKADGEAFDAFMGALFELPESADLDAIQMERLFRLVYDAPEPRSTALADVLCRKKVLLGQQLVALDCLAMIGTEQTRRVILDFFNKGNNRRAVLLRLYEIINEQMPEVADRIIAREMEFQFGITRSFLNPIEYNAEYILIPGGNYIFQKGTEGERRVVVPDMYFAKYPVTNRRYRRFIAYLSGGEPELHEQVPVREFADQLLEFAGEIEGYRNYLAEAPEVWAHKLASKYDEDRRFNRDDQPVVGVTWFAARAYCFWLSLLWAEQEREFRLPLETEWEWAAGGGVRKYPWDSASEPNEKLSNFDKNVGKTTSVRQYPDGAIPEGLVDMAGNVWEWQENCRTGNLRALRGGSWNFDPRFLRCTEWFSLNPDVRVNYFGFRVVHLPKL